MVMSRLSSILQVTATVVNFLNTALKIDIVSRQMIIMSLLLPAFSAITETHISTKVHGRGISRKPRFTTLREGISVCL